MTLFKNIVCRRTLSRGACDTSVSFLSPHSQCEDEFEAPMGTKFNSRFLSVTENMSDSKKENKEVGGNFEESLKGMPADLRLFSSAMRSLYSDKNPGESTEISRKFTKLRDEIRQDAKVYLKVIFPLTIKFVSAMKEFFEFYDALSYEEWFASLPEILEDTKANKDFAQTLLAMYEEIIVPLKKRQDEARLIMVEFKHFLQTEYGDAVKKFQAKAENKQYWADVCWYIPVINFIATPLLRSYAKSELANANAKMEESKIREAEVFIVDETLTAALKNFIKGLADAAGYFQTLEIEMNSLTVKKKEMKERHYKKIKSKVQKINPSCHDLYAALPDIRTDLEAIPNDDSQQDYLKKWLEKKLEEIQGKNANTQNHFLDVIKGIQGISLKPKMAPSCSLNQ